MAGTQVFVVGGQVRRDKGTRGKRRYDKERLGNAHCSNRQPDGGYASTCPTFSPSRFRTCHSSIDASPRGWGVSPRARSRSFNASNDCMTRVDPSSNVTMGNCPRNHRARRRGASGAGAGADGSDHTGDTSSATTASARVSSGSDTSSIIGAENSAASCRSSTAAADGDGPTTASTGSGSRAASGSASATASEDSGSAGGGSAAANTGVGAGGVGVGGAGSRDVPSSSSSRRASNTCVASRRYRGVSGAFSDTSPNKISNNGRVWFVMSRH